MNEPVAYAFGQRISMTWHNLPKKRKSDGVADGDRTRDNRSHNPVLYQLSYSHHKVVGEEGFEPPTSCSQSRRATRLRYTPTKPRSQITQHNTTQCDVHARSCACPWLGGAQSTDSWHEGQLHVVAFPPPCVSGKLCAVINRTSSYHERVNSRWQARSTTHRN